MKSEIISFIKEACLRYTGLEAIYIPSNDCYCVMYQGRAIQNFNTHQFYTFPKLQRMRELGILLKVGLANNLQEAHKNQFFLARRNGIKIC